MLRWVGALAAAVIMSAFAFLLVAGQYYREGPVLVTLTATHGIHRGDIGIIAAWMLGMIGLGASVLAGGASRVRLRR
jgi:hypothetical protein